MAKKQDPKAASKPDSVTQVETNGALPQQLRTQIAEADALRAQMNGAPQEPPPAQQEPPPVQQTPPPAQQPPPPAQQPPPPAESIEQQLRSTQGRLEQQLQINRQMHDRMGQMEQLIASMEARGVQPPPNEPPPAPAKPQLVTPEEVADFGEDLLNVVGKRAREEYAPEFEQLAARLRTLETRVDGTTTVIQRSQQQMMYDGLAADVPNWKDINRSDEFKGWLQQPDLLSGRRRHDLLMEAFSRQETPRVVAFFKGFLTEAAGPPQPPPAPGTSAPPLANPSANGNGNGSGKPTLEEFAAPGRARSAPQNELSPDKPIYSAAWIAKFMADKRTGKYRGREADADAIERDIYQAQHEGRIQ